MSHALAAAALGPGVRERGGGGAAPGVLALGFLLTALGLLQIAHALFARLVLPFFLKLLLALPALDLALLRPPGRPRHGRPTASRGQ